MTSSDKEYQSDLFWYTEEIKKTEIYDFGYIGWTLNVAFDIYDLTKIT